MLKNEAIWIGKQTSNLKVFSVLNIGEGSWFFRNIRQSYIQKYIFNNFERNSIKVTHTDFENDVCKKSFRRLEKFDLVMANNLLEHVGSIKKTVDNISSVIKTGGYLCISVPHKFPYHPCPIDNMFRPLPNELISLFPKFKVVKKKLVKDKMILGINRYNFFWINKTFSVSCAILQKN